MAGKPAQGVNATAATASDSAALEKLFLKVKTDCIAIPAKPARPVEVRETPVRFLHFSGEACAAGRRG